MKKKWIAAAAALGLLLAANLHICCAVSFDSGPVEGRYSPAAVRRGLRTATRAAEELLPLGMELAQPRLRYSLSFTPPEGESRRICDAALRATAGLAVRDGVYVNGLALGVVEDGARLSERLRAWLYEQMPKGAARGYFTEELAIRGVYTRAGRELSLRDMLMRVTGLSSVFYTDAQGELILG